MHQEVGFAREADANIHRAAGDIVGTEQLALAMSLLYNPYAIATGVLTRSPFVSAQAHTLTGIDNPCPCMPCILHHVSAKTWEQGVSNHLGNLGGRAAIAHAGAGLVGTQSYCCVGWY
jgi:hypothetical protein